MNCSDCKYLAWDSVLDGSDEALWCETKHWWMYCSHPESFNHRIENENEEHKLCPLEK